jgi:dCMP deaminase
MPSGWTNECEDTHVDGHAVWTKTKPEVIHAEANAIAKLAKSPESGVGSVLFLTHSPCMQCAKQIYTAGIEEIFYKEEYRDRSGVEFLEKCNIKVHKHE